MLFQLRARNGCADAEAAGFFLDGPSLGNPFDVDDEGEGKNLGAHLHQQIRSTSQNARVV